MYKIQTDINYDTKFQEGQKVEVIDGYHKGKIGSIEYYSTSSLKGFFNEDLAKNRDTSNVGVYEIRVGWFRTIKVKEDSLREIDGR